MTWRHLLFMHWRVEASALRNHVPRSLEIDLHDGSAWLGVVPFTMTGVRARCTPPLPGVCAFHELNVRTYVWPKDEPNKPGVWFFSLDAASRIAVRAARRGFGLPYMDSRMSLTHADDGWADYTSTRTHRGEPPATLDVRYRAGEPVAPDRLGRFLTERYCLYALRRGRLIRGQIHHAPWTLRAAEAQLRSLDMTRLLDLDPPAGPPHLLCADPITVVAWRPEPVG